MSDIFTKLKLSDNWTALIVHAPTDFRDVLQGLVYDSAFEKSNHYDFVQYFVTSFAEFESLTSQAISAGKYDCLMWVCYPKGTGKIKTDINRNTIHEASVKYNVETVSQILIDETWSAMRLRPIDAVGKKSNFWEKLIVFYQFYWGVKKLYSTFQIYDWHSKKHTILERNNGAR